MNTYRIINPPEKMIYQIVNMLLGASIFESNQLECYRTKCVLANHEIIEFVSSNHIGVKAMAQELSNYNICVYQVIDHNNDILKDVLNTGGLDGIIGNSESKLDEYLVNYFGCINRNSMISPSDFRIVPFGSKWMIMANDD